MKWNERIKEKVEKTKNVSSIISNLSTEEKNSFLEKLAQNIDKEKESIIKNNKKDVEKAKKMGYSSAFIDRLEISEKRVKKMERKN